MFRIQKSEWLSSGKGIVLGIAIGYMIKDAPIDSFKTEGAEKGEILLCHLKKYPD
jgi:hypothetical protein